MEEKKMQKVNIISKIRDFQALEAFKTLRSNIEFSSNEVKSVCVTSTAPGDGKSTVSLELACAFAQSGKTTLLIDADLRKSVMKQRIGGSLVQNGLAHLLVGKGSVTETFCATDISNLYILFAGKFPPNPSEMLGSKRFQVLMSQLKKTFDVIIVDTPPLGSVIDAALVARSCDGVLLVLKEGAVSYRVAQRIKNQLDAAGVKVLGCVLNDVKFTKRGYYGKYYKKYYGNYHEN